MCNDNELVRPSVPVAHAWDLFVDLMPDFLQNMIERAKDTGDTTPIIALAMVSAATVNYKRAIEKGDGMVSQKIDSDYIESFLDGLRLIHNHD